MTGALEDFGEAFAWTLSRNGAKLDAMHLPLILGWQTGRAADAAAIQEARTDIIS
jgi:hypothetical protein